MYSSRHNHALRRSREGSGRFVGGPVENSTTTNEASSNVSSSSSLTSSYHQSDPGVVTASTDNFMPFSHQIETPHDPHQDSPQSNTNNNNHSSADQEVILLNPPSSEEASVDNSKSRETLINNVAVS